ncbi:nucleotidyltransferase domain-containing protein [Halanaerobium sp. Z-7514]|uniref:Nucleotidyltransferase domain-containing protein n=1 Tax=Halanaerobium polyolivorans TaxID=2886943 RepID=A0AAW4X1C7_9FIRM|nr:nucleotidyltransferase domain-containing protein [Halanaerobium polyolivorans]MCC3145621.1 nucleotidyltransferase domain-containing protein [Halanaerobium polyolivorans]
MDIEKIKEILSNRKEIIFAYLFGSFAENKENPLSDIDLAIYIDQNKKPQSGVFGYRSELIVELQAAVNRDIDLVILNNITAAFAHDILKNGVLLINKSAQKRNRFHEKTMREYLDFLPMYKVQSEYLTKRIKEKRFGS